MVPLGTNTAAFLPSRAAAISSSLITIGSSPNTSSPSGAVTIARRISGVGMVTVSERRSITPTPLLYRSREGGPHPRGRADPHPGPKRPSGAFAPGGRGGPGAGGRRRRGHGLARSGHEGG